MNLPGLPLSCRIDSTLKRASRSAPAPQKTKAMNTPYSPKWLRPHL